MRQQQSQQRDDRRRRRDGLLIFFFLIMLAMLLIGSIGVPILAVSGPQAEPTRGVAATVLRAVSATSASTRNVITTLLQSLTTSAAATSAERTSSSSTTTQRTSSSSTTSTSSTAASAALTGALSAEALSLASFQSTTSARATTASTAATTAAVSSSSSSTAALTSSTSRASTSSTSSTNAASTSSASSTNAASTSSTSSTLATSTSSTSAASTTSLLSTGVTAASAAGTLSSFSSSTSQAASTTSLRASSSSSTLARSTSSTSTTGLQTTSTTLLASTSSISTIGAGATTGPDSGQDIWVDSVNGNDANSGFNPLFPVRTLQPRALQILRDTGFNTYCTIHLMPGDYPVNSGTAFDGTTLGTRQGPLTIVGEVTNITSIWNSTVASGPTLGLAGLYTFNASDAAPVTGADELSGYTIRFASGLDAGVLYTLASVSIDGTVILAYDSLAGPAPLFAPGDQFEVLGAPLATIVAANASSTWLSNNGFPHFVRNVAIDADAGGDGSLTWQGLVWNLQNVWLGTRLYEFDSLGLQLTADNCTLSTFRTTTSRQGVRIGPDALSYPVQSPSVDAAESLFWLAQGTTAALASSVYRSASFVSVQPSSAALEASLFRGNSALWVLNTRVSMITTAALARQDVITGVFFDLQVSGASAFLTSFLTYQETASLCVSECTSPLARVSGGGRWNGTEHTMQTYPLVPSNDLILASGAQVWLQESTLYGGSIRMVRVNDSASLSMSSCSVYSQAGGFLTEAGGQSTLVDTMVLGGDFNVTVFNVLDGNVLYSGSNATEVGSAGAMFQVSDTGVLDVCCQAVVMAGLGLAINMPTGTPHVTLDQATVYGGTQNYAVSIAVGELDIIDSVLVSTGGYAIDQTGGNVTISALSQIYGSMVTSSNSEPTTTTSTIITSTTFTQRSVGTELGQTEPDVIHSIAGSISIHNSVVQNAGLGGACLYLEPGVQAVVDSESYLIPSLGTAVYLPPGASLAIRDSSIRGGQFGDVVVVDGASLSMQGTSLWVTWTATNGLVQTSGSSVVSDCDLYGSNEPNANLVQVVDGTMDVESTTFETVGALNLSCCFLSQGGVSTLRNISMNPGAGGCFVVQGGNVSASGGSMAIGAGYDATQLFSGYLGLDNFTITNPTVGIRRISTVSSGFLNLSRSHADLAGSNSIGLYFQGGTGLVSGTTITNVNSSGACIELAIGSDPVVQVSAGSVLNPVQGYGVFHGNGSLSIDSSYLIGGTSKQVIDQLGGDLTITRSVTNVTGAFSTVSCQGPASVSIANSTMDGGLQAADMLTASQCQLSITGSSTIQNVGANHNLVLVIEGSASLDGSTFNAVGGTALQVRTSPTASITGTNLVVFGGTGSATVLASAGLISLFNSAITATGSQIVVWNTGANLTLVGCTISSANLTANGIQVAANTTTTISNCTLLNAGRGAACLNAGGSSTALVTVNRGTVIRAGIGSAVAITNATVTISGCTMFGGTNQSAITLTNGLLNMDTTTVTSTCPEFAFLCSSGAANIANSTFDGALNAASVFAAQGCIATVFQSSTIKNAGTGSSAAFVTSGSFYLINSAVSGGGGGAVSMGSPAVVNITSSTITGGASSAAISQSGGTFYFFSSTYTSSAATFGHQVSAGGVATITSSTYDGGGFNANLVHLTCTSCVFTAISSTFRNVGINAACVSAFSGTPTLTTTSCTFHPTQGFAYLSEAGTSTSNSDTMTCGSLKACIQTLNGGTLTVNNVTLNATVPIIPVALSAPTHFFANGGIYNGNNMNVDVIAQIAGTTSLNGVTVINSGPSSRCLSSQNPGTNITIYGGSTFANCGNGTGILITNASMASISNITFQSTRGDMIQFNNSVGSVAYLQTSGTIQGNGVNLVSNATVTELTGTNTGIVVGGFQVLVCGLSGVATNFTAVDAAGPSGISAASCLITAD